MNIKDFNAKLEQAIADNGLLAKRPHLGLSKIGDCPRRTVYEHLHGVAWTQLEHRRYIRAKAVEDAALSLYMQAGLVLPGSNNTLVNANLEGMPLTTPLLGHLDGVLTDGGVLEIKSVIPIRFERIKEQRRSEANHYRQVQAYMHFGGFREAVVSYWNVETFDNTHVFTTYLPKVGVDLERIALHLLKHIENKTLPDCECRRCKN